MFPQILLYLLIIYLFAFGISHGDFLISDLYSFHNAPYYNYSFWVSVVPSNINLGKYSSLKSSIYICILYVYTHARAHTHTSYTHTYKHQKLLRGGVHELKVEEIVYPHHLELQHRTRVQLSKVSIQQYTIVE